MPAEQSTPPHPRCVYAVDGVRALVAGKDASRRAGTLRRALRRLGCSMPRHWNRDRVIIPRRGGAYVVPFGIAVLGLDRLPDVAETLERHGAQVCYAEISMDVLNVSADAVERTIAPVLVLAGDAVAQPIVTH